MKSQAVLILVAIAVGILVPPAFPVPSGKGARTEMGMLDVCSPSMPALSAQGQMPCITERSDLHRPFTQIARAAANITASAPAVPVFRAERPPQS